MKELVPKLKIINETIPQAITDSNLYRKEIKKRMKLNSIFSEFDTKAYHDLNFFIDESNWRYSKSKGGLNLNSLITGTRKKCLDESMKVLNDKFYTNKIIEEERNKMFYKNSDKLYKQVKNRINVIKNPEIKKKELKMASLTEEGLDEFDNYDINENNINEFIRKNSNMNSPYNTLERKNSNGGINLKKNLHKDILKMNEVINTENNLIHKSLDNYKITLNKLKNKYEEAKKLKQGKEPKLNIHKKINIDFPKIKLLNYIHYDLYPKSDDDDEELRKINVRKLLPFTKYGKYYKSLNENLTMNESNKDENKDKTLPYITEPIIPDNRHYYKNYQNTICVVHDSANKELFVDRNYEKKRDDVENILCIDNIPSLKVYDYIAHKGSEKIKEKRRKKNDRISHQQNYLKLTAKQKRNVDIDNNLQSIKDIEDDLFGKETQKEDDNK
jgi:hypothetical protein